VDGFDVVAFGLELLPPTQASLQMEQPFAPGFGRQATQG
jgi:hypothetical protein